MSELLKNGKATSWIVWVGVIGLALILLSEFWPQGSAQKPSPTVTDTQAYARQMEQQLCELLGTVEGVGACRVMLTLENGVEYVYATEETVKSDYEEQPSGSGGLSQSDNREDKVILLNGDSEGLLVTEILPTVKGVVVVCAGGEDPRVVERVTAALTTALNITDKRVCVIKGA